MSDVAKATAGPGSLQQPMPAWIGSGLIGLVLGSGLTLIGMRWYAPNVPKTLANRSSSPTGGGGGAPRGNPMGMPGMGGGMMGGMGGPRGKRNLSNFVGKLELLTRGTLHVQLNPEQNAQIANQLAKLDQAEKMTEEEAQSQLVALEALLSPEQKAMTDSISLPLNRSGSGGGGMGMVSMGTGPTDDNPFRQETNAKRLHDLLARIQPAGFELPKKEAGKKEGPAKSAD